MRKLIAFRVVSADRLLEIQMQSVDVVLCEQLGEFLEPTRPELAVAQLAGRVGLCVVESMVNSGQSIFFILSIFKL